MPTYRSVKGSPLTSAEADQNIMDIYTAIANLPKSYLAGKSVYVLGDSFVQLAIVQSKLVSRLGVAITVNGIGGSCISGGTATAEGDGTSRTPIVDRIDAALATNPDILIVEGGSNDWYYQITRGDINSTDRNTYYGAWKEIVAKCQAKTVRLVPVNMMQRGGTVKGGSTTGRLNFSNQELYANTPIEVCRPNSIPVCDIFHTLGVTYENIGLYTTDNVHPNNTAGTDVYGNAIANFLLNPYVSYPIATNVTNATMVTNEAINWAYLVGSGMAFSGTTLSYTGPTANWVVGASANKRFTQTDCSIDVPSQAASNSVVVGFNAANLGSTAPNYSTMTHAFYYDGTIVRIFEKNVQKFSVNTTGSHSYSVKVELGTVKYYLDGVVIYTSTLAPVFPLVPVCAMSKQPTNPTTVQLVGATITGMTIAN